MSLKWLLFLIWLSSSGCVCFSLALGFSEPLQQTLHFNTDTDDLTSVQRIFVLFIKFLLWEEMQEIQRCPPFPLVISPSFEELLHIKNHHSKQYDHDRHTKGRQDFLKGL